MNYSWLQDYLARLDGKEARREYYERYYASWHEAARKLAEAVMESHAMIASVSAETRERQVQLTRCFFDSVAHNLRGQAEENWAATRELTEQARRWQEAAHVLTRESANAYIDFLDSMVSYYKANASAAESSGRE